MPYIRPSTLFRFIFISECMNILYIWKDSLANRHVSTCPRQHNTEKRGHIFVSHLIFEPAIPVIERSETLRLVIHAATMVALPWWHDFFELAIHRRSMWRHYSQFQNACRRSNRNTIFVLLSAEKW